MRAITATTTEQTTKTILTTIIALGGLAALATAENPYLMADNTWISIPGEVESVTSGDTFELDYYEGGLVTVEMDDWDADGDAYKLVEGDDVIVNGYIDDDTFEQTKIEASSVYVENVGTYFYASGADEEDSLVTITAPVADNDFVMQGFVTSVNGDEFNINSGLREVTVDTSEMAYDPLDDEGYQKIETGDRVSVRGPIDETFFGGQELVAESVIELED